jgi:hypothetical protein
MDLNDIDCDQYDDSREEVEVLDKDQDDDSQGHRRT